MNSVPSSSCHPDDDPPQPCARQYAYSECVKSVEGRQPTTPEGWIDRWHETDAARLAALRSELSMRSTLDEAITLLRGYVKAYGRDYAERPPEGVAGQVWIGVQRFLGEAVEGRQPEDETPKA